MATDVRVDPRIERTKRLVLRSALDELAANGYGAFSIEGVAARSGVARSTIYRHWSDRVSLITDAFETLNVQPRPAEHPELTARQRVELVAEHLAAVMADSPFAACLPALIDGAARDRRIAEYFHGYSDRRRATLTAAIAATERPSWVDPELAAQAIAGAILYRRLVTAEPLAPADVRRLVDTVLGPAAPERGAPGTRRHTTGSQR